MFQLIHQSVGHICVCTMAVVSVRVRQTVGWSAAAGEREGWRKLLVGVKATAKQSSEIQEETRIESSHMKMNSWM